ncbi:hypothetical protein EGW08_022060, partial [Elysia chlorotica]
MEVSEETLNEVGLRITPENGHVAPLLVATPGSEKAVESVVGGPSGQPMPPGSSQSQVDSKNDVPVVLLMMPERESPNLQQQDFVDPDRLVHVQALIPPGIADVISAEGHDPSSVLEVKVIPQRPDAQGLVEVSEEKNVERDPTSSSFASRGEESFLADGTSTQEESKAGAPPILQVKSASPRAAEAFSSPSGTRESTIAAPRRSVSELSAPVFARLDLLAMMKGRAKSAAAQTFSGKTATAPMATKTQDQLPLTELQREGTEISLVPGGVAPLTGRTPVGLDGIDIDVTTPRVATQVEEMNARLATSTSAAEPETAPAEEITAPADEVKGPVEEVTAPDTAHASEPEVASAEVQKTVSPAPVEKLASEQEVDSETTEDEARAEVQVNLSELKEIPILDIADVVPSEVLKPSSGQILPSEATRGSSILDINLETPFPEITEGGKPIRLSEEGKNISQGQGELMDDGSTLEKAQTHISEREATQGGGSGSVAGENTLGSRDHTALSKQATQMSATGAQKSFLGQSVTSLEGGKVEGVTEEDIRASSAHSRASLREQYKAKLEEA